MHQHRVLVCAFGEAVMKFYLYRALVRILVGIRIMSLSRHGEEADKHKGDIDVQAFQVSCCWYSYSNSCADTQLIEKQ